MRTNIFNGKGTRDGGRRRRWRGLTGLRRRGGSFTWFNRRRLLRHAGADSAWRLRLLRAADGGAGRFACRPDDRLSWVDPSTRCLHFSHILNYRIKTGKTCVKCTTFSLASLDSFLALLESHLRLLPAQRLYPGRLPEQFFL